MIPREDDSSTDIERRVRRFCADLNDRIGQLPLPAGSSLTRSALQNMRFQMSKSVGSVGRTPRQQAGYVSDKKSWVCWGAHMSDKARHVRMTLNGTYVRHPRDVFGASFPSFAELWGKVMRAHGLKNYHARDGWGEGDGYHLELPDARVPRSDARAKACLEEYVKMTRLEGRQRNDRFERKYKKELAPHLERLEPADRGAPGRLQTEPKPGSDRPLS